MRGRFVAAVLVFAAPFSVSRAAETPSPSGRTTADVLAQLDKFAAAAMAEEKVPGMVYAVVKDGAVVFSKAYGVRKVTDTTPTVTTETLFEVGSTTKAFTAALVAMEVDAGKLAWDDRVVTYLPDFKMYDPWVTSEFRVCDLLSQRSGMPGNSLDPMSALGFSRSDIEKAMAFVEPTFSFRNGFGYVNTLWLTAARLVEKLEGRTWEETIARRIFQPLGMRDSTVDPEMAALVPDRATGHYTDTDDTKKPIPDDWPFRTWLDIFGPAGNIRSTVGDMSRWAALHLAHGRVGTTALLQPPTVDALHAPRTLMANFPSSDPSGSSAVSTAYALGWIHEEFPAGTLIWHNGGTTGQHSLVGLYEHANVALVVLTNSSGNAVPERMRVKLFDLLYVPNGSSSSTTRRPELALGPQTRPAVHRTPLVPIPPLPLERYVGTYENPAYGRFPVMLKDGALVMAMGPLALEATLRPWSGNTFVMRLPFGLPLTDTFATFTVPADQNASKVVVSGFEDVRGGTFLRVP